MPDRFDSLWFARTVSDLCAYGRAVGYKVIPGFRSQAQDGPTLRRHPSGTTVTIPRQVTAEVAVEMMVTGFLRANGLTPVSGSWGVAHAEALAEVA